MTQDNAVSRYYSEQQITEIYQVLWRLGLDGIDSEDLIDLSGKCPNITLVTRLSEVTELYALQKRDSTLVQAVRTNRFNGLSLDLLLGVNVI